MLRVHKTLHFTPDGPRHTARVELAPAIPAISSRWTPGQIERRDTLAGTYECVNPRDYSNDALWLQQALFYKPAPKQFQAASAAAWGLGASLGVFVLWALVQVGL
jgi:hypothetical protein